MAAFATFKKDTTLERQGEFTLSTLQGGARAGERLNEPNDKPLMLILIGTAKVAATDWSGYHWLTYYLSKNFG